MLQYCSKGMANNIFQLKVCKALEYKNFWMENCYSNSL